MFKYLKNNIITISVKEDYSYEYILFLRKYIVCVVNNISACGYINMTNNVIIEFSLKVLDRLNFVIIITNGMYPQAS